MADPQASVLQEPAAPVQDRCPPLTPLSARVVDRICVGAILLALLIRAIAVASASFYWDDFILEGRSARLPLSWSFLTYSHDGHVMPGAFLVAWVVERIAPLQWWLPAVVLICTQAVILVVFWRLIRRMFGPRPLMLVPLTIYGLSSMSLPSGLWWSAALNALPLQLASLGAVWGVWYFWREGRHARGAALMIASLVIGLFFFEKSIMIVLLILGLAWVLTPVRQGVIGTLREVIGRQWRLWAAIAVIGAVWAGLAFSVSSRGLQWSGSVSDGLQTLYRAVVQAIAPTVAGGPITWAFSDPPAAFSIPGVPGSVLAIVVSVAVVVIGALWSWRARRAWLLVAVYVVVEVSLLVLGRGSAGFQPVVVTSLRYTADALLPIVLAVSLSIMPLAGERAPDRYRRARRWLANRKQWMIPAAVGCAIAFVSVALISTMALAQIWSLNPAKPYLARARQSLKAGASEGAILNQSVPQTILYGMAHPYEGIDWFFAPLADKPPVSDVMTNPRFLDRLGRLVPSTIIGVNTKEGPSKGCGWPVEQQVVTIPLERDLPEWDYYMAISYAAAQPTDVRVLVGGESARTLHLPAGAGLLTTVINAQGTTVQIEVVTPGQAICVSSVLLGTQAAQPDY
ncbi:MAG: hypothetical protein WCI74_09965 [Actinomycetes bacterium]